MEWLADKYIDLMKDETKAFACIATLMKDGSPQLTPVWFNTDGAHILINTTIGTVKDRNVRRDGRVAIVIIDPKNPYHYMQVRGTVVEITTQKAREHIDALSKKYTGMDKFTRGSPDQTRVTFKILPTFVSGQ